MQAIIYYLKNENWINWTISCQVLKREVKFKPLADDSVAKLCIVDENTDSKIIKFCSNVEVCYICTYLCVYINHFILQISKRKVDLIETNVQPVTKYEYPMCHLHVITEMLNFPASQLKLKVEDCVARMMNPLSSV